MFLQPFLSTMSYFVIIKKITLVKMRLLKGLKPMNCILWVCYVNIVFKELCHRKNCEFFFPFLEDFHSKKDMVHFGKHEIII